MFYKIILLSILSYFLGFSQTKTNFEIIESMVFNKVESFTSKMSKSDEYSYKFIGADSYQVFEPKIENLLIKKSFILNPNASTKLNVYLDEIKCDYSEIEKDGIFGEYIVKRDVNLSGSVTLNDNNNIFEIDIDSSYSDYIPYSQLKNVENIGYPFTSSEEPEIPLFSSLIEPAIAVGTAAIAVYLFFNVRSK